MNPTTPSQRKSEALQLARGCFAYSSVLEALIHLEAAIFNCNQAVCDDLRIQAHWTTFVVAYSRLFESSDHFGVEKPKLVGAKYKALHSEILKTHRNSTIAHIDPTNFHLNRLWFQKYGTTIVPEPERFHPPISYLNKCHELAKNTLDRIAQSISDRMLLFPEIARFSDGRYCFDMTAEAGKEWQIE